MAATTEPVPAADSPHVLVIHRWRDRYALYADYIDHRAHRVTYVTTELGRESVPAAAAAVVTVPATDDLAAVCEAVTGLAERFGPPERLVALNEGDLDVAAQVRERFGIAGQKPAELAVYRDKLVMCRRVAAAGLPVPAFAAAPDVGAVREFGRAHGWPLIVKPRRGTASRGVIRLNGEDDLGLLEAAGVLDAEPHLVQSFVDAPILHIDGLWAGNELGGWTASRYINSCADFAQGVFLGSVEEDDPELLAAVGAFAAEVGAALGPAPCVFHLESFVGVAPDGGPSLIFLECGARVGGAEIPFVWREVHAADLMAAAVDIQLGRSPLLPPVKPGEIGGYLLLPLPVPAPCRVDEAGWVPGRQPGHPPYAQVTAAPGTTVPRVGGYEHVGARFRFKGSSTREVEESIKATASGFLLRCTPVNT